MAGLRVIASSLVVAVAVAVAFACARCGRVATASRTRDLATSPSRRHAFSPSQPPHTHPFNNMITRTSYVVMSRFVLFISFVQRTRTTVFVLFTSFSLRVASRIFAFPSHYSIFVARPRLLLSRFIPMCLLSDSRRIYVALRLYQLCVAQPLHLIESLCLVIKLCIIFCCAPCVASLIVPPRRGRVRWVFVLSISFPRVDSPAASLEILFVLLLADRLHNEKRNRSHRSPCVDSPSTSFRGGEYGGYLLVFATVLRCRALHIFVSSKSLVYRYIILLNNIFPASQRVTIY